MLKAILAATLLTAAAATATDAGAATLSDLRWEKRIVIVFAVTGDGRLAEQRQGLLADAAALDDRDLLAFAVIGDRLEPIHGTPPRGETADRLRQRYGIDAGTPFAALLLGKDGGVKWRGDRPIGLAELNGLIDAMPMRRSGGR